MEEFDYKLRFIILGNPGVGKSSILEAYCNGADIYSIQQTIGVDFFQKTITVGGNKKVKIIFWDTSGQEQFLSITRNYYREASGILLVYDTTDPESFKSLSFWLNEVKEHTPSSTCIFILANKSDYQFQQVSKKEINTFSESNEVPYMEVSAKTKMNLDEAISTLANEVVYKLENGEITPESHIIEINNPIGPFVPLIPPDCCNLM